MNMTSAIPVPPARRAARRSLRSRMLDILATPGEVFDEVMAGPPCLANWLVPTLLVCLASLVLLRTAATSDQISVAVSRLADAGKLSAAQADALTRNWPSVSAFTICLGAAAGMGWSALLLWLIGRVCLKTPFAFGKALEVVGLSSVVLLLGTVFTALLVAATGDPTARPALSILAGRLPPESHLRAALDTLNFFHFWSAGVLAVGLSKLSGVGFKESAFWVLGYWIVVRLMLILLA